MQYTISEEKALASSLLKATELTPAAARFEILSLESHHAERRDWVWVKMGYAPLVIALEYLAVIAQLAQTIPGGLTPEEMGASYQERYWQVDLACLAALNSVGSPQHQEVIKRVLSTIYTPWLSEMNQVFQSLVSTKGYPGSHQVNEAVAEYQVNGECVFFIDGLRFDIAFPSN